MFGLGERYLRYSQVKRSKVKVIGVQVFLERILEQETSSQSWPTWNYLLKIKMYWRHWKLLLHLTMRRFHMKNSLLQANRRKCTLFHISVFSDIWSSLRISFDSWTETELVWGRETGIWQVVTDQDPRERERGREGEEGKKGGGMTRLRDRWRLGSRSLSPGRQTGDLWSEPAKRKRWK